MNYHVTDPATFQPPQRKDVWPYDAASTKVDLAHAVMADGVDVTTLGRYLSEPAIAVVLNGQTVRTQREVHGLYVMGIEGALSVACAIIAGMSRAQGITHEMGFSQVVETYERLRAEGKDL